MKLQKTALILSILFLSLILVAVGQKEHKQERSPEYKIQLIGEDSCLIITPEKTYKCKISQIEYLIENYNL